jgi:hypothetical protein
MREMRIIILRKLCLNANYYLKDQNLDYAGQQSDQFLHVLVKYGY